MQEGGDKTALKCKLIQVRNQSGALTPGRALGGTCCAPSAPHQRLHPGKAAPPACARELAGAPDLRAVTTCQRQRRAARCEQCSVLHRDLRGIFKYLLWTFPYLLTSLHWKCIFWYFSYETIILFPHISSLPRFSLVVFSPPLLRPPHNEGEGDSNPPQDTFQSSVP